MLETILQLSGYYQDIFYQMDSANFLVYTEKLRNVSFMPKNDAIFPED